MAALTFIADLTQVGEDHLPDHLVSFLHRKRKASSTACKHNTGQRTRGILKCEVYMTGRMILAVAHFAADHDLPEQIVLRKHAPDIGIDLTN